MADFNKAADFVLTGGLVNEGGYEPASPEDPGGETKFGISKRFASEQAGYENLDIKDLTAEDARRIYRKDFWRFDAIRDQAVASKLLDICVNAGPTGGMRWIQHSLVIFFPGKGTAIDGICGTQTLEMINECDPQNLLCELRARQVQRYVQDLQRNPAELPLAMGLWRRAAK